MVQLDLRLKPTSVSLEPHRTASKHMHLGWTRVRPGQSVPQLTGRETGEELIERFNQIYARDIKFQSQLQDNDSVSTLYESPSELIKSRQCRKIMMRRLLVISCLLLWALTFGYLLLWFLTFFIWPMDFSRDLDKSVKNSDSGAVTGRYTILAIILTHSFIVGTGGLVSAYCGRNRILKRFILLAPWVTLLAVGYILIAIQWYGGLSKQKLQLSMQRRLGSYYKTPVNPDEQVHWIKVQYYLRCCGIESKWDWINSNSVSDEKLPGSCCRTQEKPYRRETDPEKVEECMHDPHGTNAWDEGCLHKLYDFFVMWAVIVVSMGFSSIVLILLSIFFGYRYYTLQKKLIYRTYRYTGKEYMIDFCCLRCCCKNYMKKLHRRDNTERDALPDIEFHEARERSKSAGSIGSPGGPSSATVLYKNPLYSKSETDLKSFDDKV